MLSSKNLDRFFGISRRNSTVFQEIRAGFVLFATCAYIIVVNADVLSLGGFASNEVAMATTITASLGSLAIGVFGNVPLCLAPGMGVNGMVAFELVREHHLRPAEAMACCFVAGFLLLIVGASGLGPFLISKLPKSIKLSLVSGIGLLQAAVALSLLGIELDDKGRSFSNFVTFEFFIFGFTIVLLTTLMAWQVPGALLIGVFVSSLCNAIFRPEEEAGGGGRSSRNYYHFTRLKDFDSVGQIDFSVYRRSHFAAAASLLLFVMILVDSGGVLTGLLFQLEESEHEIIESSKKKLSNTLPLEQHCHRATPPHHSRCYSFVSHNPTTTHTEKQETTTGSSSDTSTKASLGDEQCPDNCDAQGSLEMSFSNPQLLYAILGMTILIASVLGVSPPLIMLESAAALKSGGRTGLTGVVCGLLFLIPFSCLAIVKLVPAGTAAAVLILIGSMMVGALTEIDWNDRQSSVVAFLTLSLIPLTSSITNGVVVGVTMQLILTGINKIKQQT